LVDEIRTQQFQNAQTNILTWNLHAGGTLIDLCSGPLTVAGGLEYRSQELIISNDPNSVNRNIIEGNFLGVGTNARRYVRSGYVQASIPIFGEKWSWPGMRSLQVVLSERYDDYSLFNSSAKPQIAVLYKPFDDLTFRGTYSEAFVAPSLSQLFTTPLLFQALVTNPVLGDRECRGGADHRGDQQTHIEDEEQQIKVGPSETRGVAMRRPRDGYARAAPV